uniref:Uncharacterized protein n=1 Tax=Timema poppense TaxID=170557 RepID=A0A7R9GU19_TIMPO|nr:unnamed protein product [Timema poppensis]
MLTHEGGYLGRCSGKPADVVSVVTNKITRSSSYFQQDLRRTGSDTLAQSVACLATETRVPGLILGMAEIFIIDQNMGLPLHIDNLTVGDWMLCLSLSQNTFDHAMLQQGYKENVKCIDAKPDTDSGSRKSWDEIWTPRLGQGRGWRREWDVGRFESVVSRS